MLYLSFPYEKVHRQKVYIYKALGSVVTMKLELNIIIIPYNPYLTLYNIESIM